jgi:hypothetical protein
MRLAEALILRADCQKRLEHLKTRLTRSAKVQEGEQPPEQPTELLEEMERTAAELESLIRRINRTNAETPFEGGGTLTDALASRDVLGLRRAIYADLAAAATVTQDRYSKSEVKFKSTVSVAEMQKRADTVARAFRELDARIQEANWRTDLIDA